MELQTKIRFAAANDIPQLVQVDRISYGDYGADETYFAKQLASPDAKVFVVKARGTVTGFAVVELLGKGQVPEDYSGLDPNVLLEHKWVQISAFTTQSNYTDAGEDSKLVEAIEDFGNANGYSSFGTCLSIAHPYPAAFSFWEQNDYEKVGTIQWVGSPKEPIDCYLYLK